MGYTVSWFVHKISCEKIYTLEVLYFIITVPEKNFKYTVEYWKSKWNQTFKTLWFLGVVSELDENKQFMRKVRVDWPNMPTALDGFVTSLYFI